MILKILLFMFITLIGVMMALNPTEEEHQEAVKETLLDIVGRENLILDGMFYMAAKGEITSKSYVLFSITKFRGHSVGIGILGIVVIKNENLIKYGSSVFKSILQ